MASIDVATFRELLQTELPRLLREHPESRHELWGLMLESFPSRREFGALRQEVSDFREETSQHFEDLERRMEEGFRAVRQELRGEMREMGQELRGEMREMGQELRGEMREMGQELRGEMQEGFQTVREDLGSQIQGVRQDLDRLGSRWGIRSESVFRQTIATVLEKSFGAKVESRWIDGEEYDVIISDGAHILVEIMASAGPKTQERLERKRSIYAGATGVLPARVVLAVASIHSRRAQALRDAGFEVIEPEEEALE